jgi:hypothetical protein
MSAQNLNPPYVRDRKNLLGQYPPQTTSIKISHLINDYNEYNTRPVYQRDIKWSSSAMNDFISTVMNNGLVPAIIMYDLAPDEKIGENEGKTCEIVDGQHRLFTLKAFVDSTYRYVANSKKKFIVYWEYENNVRVFYQQTEDVTNWCNEKNITPYFLTYEEKGHFDRFPINVTTIRSGVSLDQRREVFMSLQRGIPVRNSDFLKNKTDNKLVAFMSENGYEELMKIFFNHCHKKANNYWVQWVARCFLLYKDSVKNPNDFKRASETFTTKDGDIKVMIDKNKSKSILNNNNDDDIIDDFHIVFKNFIEFLKKFKDENILNPTKPVLNILNPTQIFALFYVLCDKSIDREMILTHKNNLSGEGKTKDYKTIWESNSQQYRQTYFINCLNQLSSITEPPSPPQTIDNGQIDQKLRKKVWKKCRNNMCCICHEKIDFENFHSGHIIARACGGKTEIDNLIPICKICNNNMDTRNAYEYQKKIYPELVGTYPV